MSSISRCVKRGRSEAGTMALIPCSTACACSRPSSSRARRASSQKRARLSNVRGMSAPPSHSGTSTPCERRVVNASKMRSPKSSFPIPSSSMCSIFARLCANISSKPARSLASSGSCTSCFHTTEQRLSSTAVFGGGRRRVEDELVTVGAEQRQHVLTLELACEYREHLAVGSAMVISCLARELHLEGALAPHQLAPVESTDLAMQLHKNGVFGARAPVGALLESAPPVHGHCWRRVGADVGGTPRRRNCIQRSAPHALLDLHEDELPKRAQLRSQRVSQRGVTSPGEAEAGEQHAVEDLQ
eukprot:scaffold160448_cov27-Tisochrysis_lutea.AAC.5